MVRSSDARSAVARPRLPKDDPRVRGGSLIRAALSGGRDEFEVRSQIENAYYDSDLEAGREELGRLAGNFVDLNGLNRLAV